MKRKLSLFIVLVLLLTVVMVGCTTPAATDQPVAEENTTVVEKTVVVEVEKSAVTNVWGKAMPFDAVAPADQELVLPCQEGKYLDVAASFYDSSRSCGAIFLWERLVMLDQNSQVLPGAASSWEMSEDGLSWTFHLREDGIWSDGTPLKASDFEFALKRQLDPKTGSGFTWFYSDILNAGAAAEGSVSTDEIGIKALDDYTLEIKTAGVIPYLPQIMAFPSSSPVPQHIVEKVGDNWADSPDTCVTNGPWKLGEYEVGQKIVLVPNDKYIGDYPPYVERLVFKPGDGISDFPAYQAGEIDGLFADQDTTPVSPTAYKMAMSDPRLRRELFAYPYFATRYFFFDPTVEPWNDIKVRQAFAHAIDRDALLNVIYDGLGAPAYGMLPPGFPAYEADALTEYQAYDIELAKSLLAEAGYPEGKGFPVVEFWYKTYEDALPMTAEMIQSMIKENLGITIELRPVETKVFNSTYAEGKIDFGMQNWEFDYIDPSNFLNVWNPDLGRHKEWNNAEFNELTNKAAGWANQEERMQMYADANKILSEDVGGVFLYHWGHAQMWKPYVKGIDQDSLGYMRVPYYNLGFRDIYKAVTE